MAPESVFANIIRKAHGGRPNAARAASNPSAASASNSIQIMQRALTSLSTGKNIQMGPAQIVMRRLCKIVLLFMENLILLLFKLRLLDFGGVIGWTGHVLEVLCGKF
jgi:hypothetical protein